MNPPLLPNPSGDGLQFYKRRRPVISPNNDEDPTDIGASTIGYCMHSFSI